MGAVISPYVIYLSNLAHSSVSFISVLLARRGSFIHSLVLGLCTIPGGGMGSDCIGMGVNGVLLSTVSMQCSGTGSSGIGRVGLVRRLVGVWMVFRLSCVAEVSVRRKHKHPYTN